MSNQTPTKPTEFQKMPFSRRTPSGRRMTFEEFVAYLDSIRPDSEEVEHLRLKALAETKQRLEEYEQKYGMTTQQFIEKIYGTPAEDTADFIAWGMDYETYQHLLKQGVENGNV